jgi:hypothetical protein
VLDVGCACLQIYNISEVHNVVKWDAIKVMVTLVSAVAAIVAFLTT